MKKKLKKILVFALMMVVMMTSSNMSVLAAGSEEASTNEVTPRLTTLVTGSNYLGNFTFANVHRGGARIVNGNRMRVCVAFKKADSQSANIDLIVDVDRYYGDGYYVTRQSTRFMSQNASPDDNGYHYLVGDWINVGADNGQPISLYYDVVTAYGQTGNGSYRAANVYVWIEVE